MSESQEAAPLQWQRSVTRLRRLGSLWLCLTLAQAVVWLVVSWHLGLLRDLVDVQSARASCGVLLYAIEPAWRSRFQGEPRSCDLTLESGVVWHFRWEQGQWKRQELPRNTTGL